MMAEMPDRLGDIAGVVEMGGAIGRQASPACRQGQHDLCTDASCQCRHHGLCPLMRTVCPEP